MGIEIERLETIFTASDAKAQVVFDRVFKRVTDLQEAFNKIKFDIPLKAPSFSGNVREMKEMLALQTSQARAERAIALAKQATLGVTLKEVQLERERDRLTKQQVKTPVRTALPSSSRPDSAMTRALADIARMQKQTAAGEKQITNTVEREARNQSQTRIREMRRAANDMLREIDRVSRAETQLSKKSKNASGGNSGMFGAVFGGSFTGNLAADAIQRVTSLAVEGGKIWLDYSSKLEQTKIGFATLMGGSAAAEQHLKDLQNFAKTTPFEFAGLADASRRLQGVGVESKKIIPLMRDIGNAAAAAGASSEQLDRITLAFSQIIAKGKLSAEEVNQLAENGIPAWQMLSETLGKSKAEVIKLAEAGAISSDIFIAAFQQFSQAKFGDAMEKQSRTFAGAMSNIKDTLLITSNTAFEPLYNEISKMSVRFADEIGKQGNDLDSIGVLIAQYIGEGIGRTLPNLIKGAASQSVSLVKKTATGDWSGFGFYGVDWLRGFGSGVSRELGFGSGDKDPLSFADTKEINGVTYALDKTTNTLKAVKKEASSIPNVKEKLAAAQAAAEAEKLQKGIGDIVRDLGLQIRFYGDESKEAAVKQQLLRQGAKDFNSALAEQAIALARQLDAFELMKTSDKIISDLRQKIQYYGNDTEVAAVKQRLLSEGIKDLNSGTAQLAVSLAAQLDSLKAADEQKKKIKDLGDEIKKVREDASFDIRFPNASELNRFDDWVKRNAAGFRELAPEIAKTRAELQRLSFFNAESKRTTQITSFIDNIKAQIQELKGSENTLDFNELVKKLVEPLNLDKADKNPITNDRFATHLASIFSDWSNDLDKAVGNAQEQKRLNDLYWDIVDDFLKLSKVKTDDENNPFLSIFADKKDYENALMFQRLWNSVIDARDKAFNEKHKEFTAFGLENELESERQKIELLKATGAKKREIVEAEINLSIKEENIKHKQFTAELDRQKKALLALTKNEETKLQIQNEYNQQLEAENARHNAAMGTINAGNDQFSISGRLDQMMKDLPGYKQIWDDFVVSLPNSMADALGQIASNWDGTWKGLADSAKRAFGQMLLDLAQQYLQSAFAKLIGSLVGKLVGALGGSLSGPAGTQMDGIDFSSHPMFGGGFASGGIPPLGRASIVGENGPEIFVPRINGRVLSNEDSVRAISGANASGGIVQQNISITQTIHAPRGTVAPKSARQAADMSVSAVARSMKQ